MDGKGCVHLNQFKNEGGKRQYKLICACVVACSCDQALKTKAYSCVCLICRTYAPRLHACMHCAFFGCYNARHIHEHADVKKHNLAVDLSYGAVYCFLCEDYIHDIELEAILRVQRRKSAKLLGLKDQYYSWEPDARDLQLLKLNPRRIFISKNSYLGLRGLINLGSTCFMNCILQSLIHTPVLRDYFLSERHVCAFKEGDSACMVCEMSKLFQEFYSGETQPYIPCRLLFLVWQNAEYLAAYNQQDAHEFFLAILNILHQHCGRNIDANGVSDKNPDYCGCIVDQIFTGCLKCDIVCGTCGDVSTKIDRFVDISLGVGTSSKLKSSSAHGKSSQKEETSLLECLDSYTKPQTLEDAECSVCQNSHKSAMLTIKKLPVIISFHFKRLQQTHKKETFISFPECLDMTPFMSSYHQNSSSNSMTGDGYLNVIDNNDNTYCLFAVVNHEGSFKGGHYTCFIRLSGDQWFKCDDEYITRAHVEDVLSSEGYLLFYHKQILEYQ